MLNPTLKPGLNSVWVEEFISVTLLSEPTVNVTFGHLEYRFMARASAC